MLRVEEIVFPREDHANLLSKKRIATLSALKTYIKVKGYIRQIDQDIYDRIMNKETINLRVRHRVNGMV